MALPPGSELESDDVFAEKGRGRFWVLFLVVIAAVLFGFWRVAWLDRWLPERWQRNPPAAEEVVAAEAGEVAGVARESAVAVEESATEE